MKLSAPIIIINAFRDAPVMIMRPSIQSVAENVIITTILASQIGLNRLVKMIAASAITLHTTPRE